MAFGLAVEKLSRFNFNCSVASGVYQGRCNSTRWKNGRLEAKVAGAVARENRLFLARHFVFVVVFVRGAQVNGVSGLRREICCRVVFVCTSGWGAKRAIFGKLLIFSICCRLRTCLQRIRTNLHRSRRQILLSFYGCRVLMRSVASGKLKEMSFKQWPAAVTSPVSYVLSRSTF